MGKSGQVQFFLGVLQHSRVKLYSMGFTLNAGRGRQEGFGEDGRVSLQHQEALGLRRDSVVPGSRTLRYPSHKALLFGLGKKPRASS